tara:strand:+ start:1321 stop:1542 length:222 start_codon:yes stop_codon:yes gene_type:complete
MDFTQTLIDYGVLGCWVVYSILRERFLLKKMEELSLRFDEERKRWNSERSKWLTTLGRKLSDYTIDETMRRDD